MMFALHLRFLDPLSLSFIIIIKVCGGGRYQIAFHHLPPQMPWLALEMFPKKTRPALSNRDIEDSCT